MQTQKEDLDKGISDLTGVLEELKGEMQRKFDAGFNEINANFTQIFRELFGGGKAEMQLDYTDCDDPLNAGIEIVACPPGKKLTKIRSEEHTSELQSRFDLVCRLLLEKKKPKAHDY